MATITTLPSELLAFIFGFLDNTRYIMPWLLTCRRFLAMVVQNANLKAHVLKRHIRPELLPYAIAGGKTIKLEMPRDAVLAHDVLDVLYREPSRLETGLRTTPIALLIEIGRIHDIIHELVESFAADAWCLMSGPNTRLPHQVDLSCSEFHRFFRAMYRVQLYYNVFSESQPGDIDSVAPNQYDWFFSRHAPWENEQLGCVHNYLEKRLLIASRDVLAHDVIFGTHSINYLSPGGQDPSIQHWLSKGFGFIHQILKEPCYETKHALLDSAMGGNGAPMFEVSLRMSPMRASSMPHVVWAFNNHSHRMSTLGLEGQIMDVGPKLAWQKAHMNTHQNYWVMDSENAGRRELAYVMWDLDRIERYQMFDILDCIPEHTSYMPTEEELNDMEKSFKSRSTIWEKGGEGFWIKGDTSRIVWSDNLSDSCGCTWFVYTP